MEREEDVGGGAEVLVSVATAALERTGEVNMSRGVEVPPSADVRLRPKISAYTGEGATHLNGDSESEPDSNIELGAEGAPSGPSITQGVACAKEGSDQRDGLAGIDVPAEDRECDRTDMDECDSATRSTLGTCPGSRPRLSSRSCPFPLALPSMVCRRMRLSAGWRAVFVRDCGRGAGWRVSPAGGSGRKGDRVEARGGGNLNTSATGFGVRPEGGAGALGTMRLTGEVPFRIISSRRSLCTLEATP